MRSIRMLFAAAVLLAAFPASASRDLAGEKAIMKRMQEFQVAWNQHDAKLMAGFMAEDSTLINPMGRVATGRSQIETLFTEEHATFMKESQFTFRDTKFNWVRPDLAMFDTEIDLVNMKKPDGSSMTLGHHMFGVMAKQGKTWVALAVRPYVFSPKPGAAPTTAQ